MRLEARAGLAARLRARDLVLVKVEAIAEGKRWGSKDRQVSVMLWDDGETFLQRLGWEN